MARKASCITPMVETFHQEKDDQEREQQKIRLLDQWWNADVIRIADTSLSSGRKNADAPLSPIYFECSSISSFPDVYQQTTNQLCQKVSESVGKPDFVAGIPVGGLVLAAPVALQLETGLIIPRTEEKTHGTRKRVEGLPSLSRGKQVTVIEDVVSTGGSVLSGVRALREEGMLVENVFCLIDREHSGGYNLSGEGCRLHSLFTRSEILSYLRKFGKIGDKEYERIISGLQRYDEYLKSVQQ